MALEVVIRMWAPPDKRPLTTRECDGQPWGFPGQPAPVPVKTRTCVHGYGFSRVRVMGFFKPVGPNPVYGLPVVIYLFINVIIYVLNK